MKWEYKVVLMPGADMPDNGIFFTTSADLLEMTLNHFGNEGWELASVLGYYSKSLYLNQAVVMLKRPLN